MKTSLDASFDLDVPGYKKKEAMKNSFKVLDKVVLVMAVLFLSLGLLKAWNSKKVYNRSYTFAASSAKQIKSPTVYSTTQKTPASEISIQLASESPSMREIPEPLTLSLEEKDILRDLHLLMKDVIAKDSASVQSAIRSALRNNQKSRILMKDFLRSSEKERLILFGQIRAFMNQFTELTEESAKIALIEEYSKALSSLPPPPRA